MTLAKYELIDAEKACAVPEPAPYHLTCGFVSALGSPAILTDQTADGMSSLYSSREIDLLSRIVHGWP